MLDGTIRLWNSLRLLAPLGQWTSDMDWPFQDRAYDLRRAFPLADAASLQALTAICSLVSVPSGSSLIQEGNRPEAVYVVVTGLLAACQPATNGQEALLERYGVSDVIGDAEFITGKPRETTIRALRDSELLRMSTQDLQAAAARCPGVLLMMASRVVQRLQRGQPATATPLKFRTFCLAPLDPAIDARPILQKVAMSLEAFGSVTIVSADQRPGQTAAWLSELERHFDFVLLQADCGPTAWTRLCLRPIHCLSLRP
jgi:NTE family protein